MRSTRWFATPIVLVACTIIWGCAPELDCEGDWCGTLVVVSAAEPPTLFPPFAGYQVHIALADLLFWRLADVGPELISQGTEGFVPRLAERWDFSSDSLTITFSLNPDARWHDGMPVTANDVVFTFDIYRDTLVNALAAPRLGMIRSVSAVDSLNVAIEFGERYPEQLFDAVYHTRILPAHTYDTIPRSTLREHPLVRDPIGSGPFRFNRWDTGESLELLADSSFFAGRPGVRRILWRFSTVAQTMITQLAAGEVDLLYPVTGTENINRVSEQRHLSLLSVPSNAYHYIGFNFRDPTDPSQPHPLFSSRDIRRAITMAVDRQSVVRSVLGEAGSALVGPLTDGLWIWDADIEQVPFDREEASRLLASSGWVDSDGDGILDKDGAPLSFELLVISTSIPRQRASVIIQDQLKQVGIEIEIQALDPNALGPRVMSQNFDAYFGAWGQDPSPGSIGESWTTAGIGAGNYGHYSNPAIDRMVDDVRSELDPSAARAAWKEIVGSINADAPAIWVYGGTVHTGIHKRFQNVSFPWDEWWKNLWTFRVDATQLIDRDLAVPR